jgi:hypothetical protein
VLPSDEDGKYRSYIVVGSGRLPRVSRAPQVAGGRACCALSDRKPSPARQALEGCIIDCDHAISGSDGASDVDRRPVELPKRS